MQRTACIKVNVFYRMLDKSFTSNEQEIKYTALVIKNAK